MKENRMKDKVSKLSSKLQRGKGESDGFVAEYVLLSNPNVKQIKNK